MPDFKILNTNHTGMTVLDIDRTIAFFRDVLGFPVTEKTSHSCPLTEQITGVEGAAMDIAFVDLPGHKIELLQYHSPDDRKVSDLRACDAGFMHLALEVDDVDACLAAIRAGGFEALNPPASPSAGPRKGGKVVYTRNLDGIVLELQQSPKPQP